MAIKEHLEPKKEILATTKEVVELISKIMLGGLAVCYSLGLLVVNLHYSRFGVYSLSLFRVTYVAAGMWVFVPTLFVILAIVTVMFMLGKVLPQMDWVGIPATFRIGLGAAFLVFLLAALSTIAIGLKINLSAKQGFWLLFGSGLTGAVIVKLLVIVFITKRRFLSAVLSILLPIGLIMHSVVFAGIYGDIPAHLGGGGTKDVQLLLTIEDIYEASLDVKNFLSRPRA